MAEEKKQEGAAGPSNLGKILSLVFAVVNLAVTGGGAFLVYQGTLGVKSHSVSEEELNVKLVEYREQLDIPAINFTMDTFNTNLQGLPRRFIRMEVSVEMYNRDGYEELVTLGAESRDEITRIINGKRFEDLESVQGKLHLKSEIVAHLNESMKRGVVKNIYFTKFQVQ